MALLGAASGYTFAALDAGNAGSLLAFFAAHAQGRLAEGFLHARALVEVTQLEPQKAWYEARNLLTQMLRREQAELRSFSVYAESDPGNLGAFSKDLEAQAAMLNGWIDRSADRRGAHSFLTLPPWHGQPDAERVPVRVGEFGPLTFQNDDVLLDRLRSERVSKIKLLNGESNRLISVQDRGVWTDTNRCGD